MIALTVIGSLTLVYTLIGCFALVTENPTLLHIVIINSISRNICTELIF